VTKIKDECQCYGVLARRICNGIAGFGRRKLSKRGVCGMGRRDGWFGSMGSMGVWMEVWKYGSMGVWEYESMYGKVVMLR
jgi:hypothetical protein